MQAAGMQAALAGMTNTVVEFKAGCCEWDGRNVKPDKRKGVFRLVIDMEGVQKAQWCDRTSGTPVMVHEFMIMRNAYLQRVEKVTDGRV